ncbi:MAG TPA: glycosyltransferase family 4 protein [Pyrinomonadaceae bacterium]|jgi:glycosyltransferase involved in cell wall biosynthesis|nr:glycosyltransferase family 4 protein [Pyrinomonadaceae bacterium]
MRNGKSFLASPGKSILSGSGKPFHAGSSPPVRIVFLNPSGQMGGAEVALLDILASIRAAEPEWNLNLIVSANGPLAAKATELGVSTTVIPFPRSLARIGDASTGERMGQARLLARLLFASAGSFKYARKLRQELQRLNAELIHTNGFKMHILGALAKPPGVPLIWHIHDYLSSRRFMVPLMKLLSRRCSIVLANSNSVKADIEAVCGDRFLVQTVYNAVDESVFSPAGPTLDLDRLSGLPPPAESVVRVGMLATFARWKGHEVFLRALALVPASVPLRAYVVGDALYQTDGSQHSLTELKGMAQDLGIADRVGFTGFVAQPAGAMRSLDIVVHASTQPEPFGLVIIEGMACGRAVIVSEAGGAAELIQTKLQPNSPAANSSNIETEINALGHAPGDAAQLAERITQLASDSSLRARLGAAGRATVERRFKREQLAIALTQTYRQLVPQRIY